jgi:hypothetical protein
MAQVKLEIRKELKANGDIFFYVYKNDRFVDSSTVLVSDGDEDRALKKVTEIYENVKNGLINNSVVKSEIIEID